MNALDVLILAAMIGAGVGGYRLGFVARATSWLGMLVGILVAARALGPVARWMEDAGDGRILLTAFGLLLGGAFLGQAVGLLIGARLHYALRGVRAREVDRSAGAVMGILGIVAAVWLLTPAMARMPGTAARLARTSSITRVLSDALPTAPDTWRELEQLVGTDFPSVLGTLDPAPDLPPPPAASGLTDELQNTVAQSTVRVEAEACGRLQDGSGAVLGPELIVTNAHVVAGGGDIVVERHPDGVLLPATLVAFDPARDVAVLQVPGIDRQPLPLGDAAEGSVGAVFGHPGGGDLQLRPYQVGREVTATGRDIYDQARTTRQVLFLASQLHPGDSGGALVDPSGAVAGLAFAIAPDDGNVAYALTTEEVSAVLNGPLAPTDSGPCLR